MDDRSQAVPARRRLVGVRLALLKATVLLLVLLALFGAGEIALRLSSASPKTATVLSSYFTFDRDTGWIGRRGAAGRFATNDFDAFISHDADGLRRCGLETGIADDAHSSVPVTWVLGDSGTWGWGVDDGETYVDHLNRASGGKQFYRNLGMCGFSTVQQVRLLDKFFARGWLPDRVLVLFCNNDLRENVDSRDQRPPRPYYVVDGDAAPRLTNHPVGENASWNIKAWLVVHSRAFNWLNFTLKRAQLRAKKLRSAPASLAGEPSGRSTESATDDCPEPQRRALGAAYGEMSQLCEAHGVALAVATELDSPGVLGEVCAESGIALVDLATRWRVYQRERGKSHPTSFAGDPHYNAAGHQLLAEALLERVGPRPDAWRWAARRGSGATVVTSP